MNETPMSELIEKARDAGMTAAGNDANRYVDVRFSARRNEWYAFVEGISPEGRHATSPHDALVDLIERLNAHTRRLRGGAT
jgi:hypothetical protein